MSTGHEEKMANLTRQLRHNQSDLQSFLSDLDSWESDIKKKEEKLMSGQSEKNDPSLPPVRNTIHKKKLKKKEKNIDASKEKQKISGYDFRSWDKFDVDAALEEIDQKKDETSSSEYETDEEWEMERKLHLAAKEKEKGNNFFKSGEYDNAVEAYSKGMEYDATNAVLPANRAMALLKQQKYAAAELDCTSSILLDPMYVKAYLRRATARANLNKHKEAIEDYNRVLDLEPTNKMAATELERLEKEKDRDGKAVIPSTLTDDDRGLVKAIYKSPEERSKVPLKRIEIEEIGIETTKRNQQPLSEQSELTKKITEREGKNFDNLIANSQKHTGKSELDNPKTQALIAPLDESTSASQRSDSQPTRNQENTKDAQQIVDIASADKSHSRGKEEAKVNGFHTEISKVHSDLPPKVTTNDQGQDVIPKIPQSSFQFQTDFKLLKNKTKEFFQYFTAIPPSEYPKLFGQCLDADILKAIIKALLDYYQDSRVNVYQVLSGLTNVKRFSMTAMFLSQKDKQGAMELMDHISSSNLCSQQELCTLKKQYDL